MRLVLRLLRGAVSLWVIVSLVFLGLRLSGDPVLALLNPDDFTREMIDSLRVQWGFSGTVWEQYLVYVSSVARGHFGTSILNGRDAFTEVMERLPATLGLVAASTAVMLAIGLPVGTLAALRVGSRLDGAVMAASTLGFAMPSFFLGLLLMLLFAVALRILPSGGSGTAAHFVLPVVTMGVAKAAILTRFVRSSVLEAVRLPCVMAARARGFGETTLFFRQILPNALLPTVTMLPLLVGAMISASAVVETVFAWPGAGRLLVESVAQRNLAIVQVIIMLVAIVMITTNLVVDLLYLWIDPRTASGRR